MRKIARRDANHVQIVAAFRKLGCSVLDLAAIGNGCPDLLVCKGDKHRLVEVKNDKQPPSGRLLTDDQAKFHSLWPGRIVICTSVEHVPMIIENL